MIKLKLLLEDFHADYRLFDLISEIKLQIFQNFLYKNNEDMTKSVPWKVIPFSKLKNAWEGFMKHRGIDEELIDDIADLMIYNTCKIYIFTELSGHTSADPEDDYEDAFEGYIDDYILTRKRKQMKTDKNQLTLKFYKKLKGKNIKNKYLDNFISINDLEEYNIAELKPKLMKALEDAFLQYYIEDPNSKGQAYISDYGLEPLMNLVFKLNKEKDAEKKIYLIDRMLNVVHQRSDIASWFVQGGTASLNKLSGYGENDSALGNYD